MQTTTPRAVSSFVFMLAVSVAMPAIAQQYSAAPRQSVAQPKRPAPTRSAQRAPVQRAQATEPRGANTGRYPVRQAAANEVAPAAPQANGVVPNRAPFELTATEQALLDAILQKWEQQNQGIKTFTCNFGRWEINETFGPAAHSHVLSEAKGDIKYVAPDRGVYIVNKQTEWDKSKNAYVNRAEALDHWVCDGKAIYEYDQAKKQLIERQLAPELQGKAITDGPLPFVFGTKADQLKRRYWMKDITPADDVNKKIWLEAWPKYQRDAANFQHAVIVLNARDFMPSALRIILPDGKNKQDYSFENVSVDNPLDRLANAFFAPRTPFGWTKVVIPAGGEQVPPPAPGAQAQQPGVTQRQ